MRTMQAFSIKPGRPLRAVSVAGGDPTSATSSHTLGNGLVNSQVIALDGESADQLAETEQPASATSSQPIAEVQQLLLRINQNVEEFKQSQHETLHQFQELSVRLAVKIAHAVVLHDVNHHEERIRNLIEKFLQQNDPQSNVVVRVNPNDMDRLTKTLTEIESLGASIELQQDATVASGDCRIEALQRTVVASIERQLDEIFEQMMEALDHARAERKSTDTESVTD